MVCPHLQTQPAVREGASEGKRASERERKRKSEREHEMRIGRRSEGQSERGRQKLHHS